MSTLQRKNSSILDPASCLTSGFLLAIEISFFASVVASRTSHFSNEDEVLLNTAPIKSIDLSGALVKPTEAV